MLCAHLSTWWSDQLHPPPCSCSGCHRKSGVVLREPGWFAESFSFKIVRIRRGKEKEREKEGKNRGRGGFFLYLFALRAG